MKDIDVLVIGRSCLDIISVVEQFPLEATKIPLLYRTVEGAVRVEMPPAASPGWEERLPIMAA